MEIAWRNYFEEQFNLPRVSQVLVYTDKYQFWLLNGLLEVLKQKNIPVSTQFLDRISTEDAIDIQQSFSSLPESCVILGIFSNLNPSIDLLNQLFPPLRQLHEFSGTSVISLQSFPNQNYSDFLELDYQNSLSLMDEYQDIIIKDSQYLLESSSGTNLALTISSKLVNFPFHSSLGRSLLFPATELIAEIDQHSITGQLVIDGTIGVYQTTKAIIDPFGKVYSPIMFEIENGLIKKIEGNDRFVPRLREYISNWSINEKRISKIGLGIGAHIDLTGIIEVDKMIYNTCNLSLGERELDLLFLGPSFSLL